MNQKTSTPKARIRRSNSRQPREQVVSFADGELRPRWRGRIHFGGFLISIPAGVALLLVADSLVEAAGLMVYVLSLMLLFGTSAAYHLLARSERAQRLMRRLDHSMIFVQIAGTYTPVCLLALPPQWGYTILAVIWASAAAGIAVKLLAGPRLLRISNVLYLVLGWVAIVALPVIIRHMSRGEFVLLVLGGVTYTVGAILFACRRPRLQPQVFGYHEVWHGFTIVAALAHFGMVWLVAV